MESNAVPNLSGRTEKRWVLADRLTAAEDQALVKFPGYLRQILINRGIKDSAEADTFLAAQPLTPSDPFLLTGMEVAVERLWQAVENREPIAVYGDYDVDGVTATVLMVEALRAAGGEVQPYIPNRFEEGYGLNVEALRTLADSGVRLVITVDCGARSLREADFTRTVDLDLIISDHHQPGSELPEAVALINPKQPGDAYPDKDLTGVGLAYKVVEGFLQLHPLPGVQAAQWLDLVALGTIADMAPLLGENRSLVAKGIQQIRAQTRQGISSLAEAAGLHAKAVTAGDIGFTLAPRLNAAGRLQSALDAYYLLITRDAKQTGKLAQELNVQNAERQKLTREMQQQAAEIVMRENPQAMLLFAAHPDFNEGIIGLAASRLVDMYYRPAIVAKLGEEFTRGSCRSIPEFNITEALDQCVDLLVRHGGHRAAAGFTVRSQDLPALVARLQVITQQKLGGMELHPVIFADFELPLEMLINDYVRNLFYYLEKLQPNGIGNPEPTFLARNLVVKRAKAVGKDNSHLQLTLLDSLDIFHDAIAFRQGSWLNQLPEQVDVLYTLEKDSYFTPPKIKLNIKAIRAANLLPVNPQYGI